MSSHGSLCWSLMRRAKTPGRSFGGTCKAQNSLTTSETLMFPISLALNQRFSYLQQVLRSSDGGDKSIARVNRGDLWRGPVGHILEQSYESRSHARFTNGYGPT